ncbi:hypothetical protein [Roseomonas elaeocarpi]|uniref:DUF3072 domain-containing protein n=1 Tax=Roseomonas elaeocarpi TaxID=907779 RepID=A0ABV6K0V5_9PROT
MSEEQVPRTKYLSEEVWRRSLAMQLENLRRVPGASVQEVQRTRRRIARIRADGLPEWRERYDAEHGKGG